MSVWHGSLKETKNDKKNHGALVTDDLLLHMDFLQSSWVLRIENSWGKKTSIAHQLVWEQRSSSRGHTW
jgi:hypothetical protein